MQSISLSGPSPYTLSYGEGFLFVLDVAGSIIHTIQLLKFFVVYVAPREFPALTIFRQVAMLSQKVTGGVLVAAILIGIAVILAFISMVTGAIASSGATAVTAYVFLGLWMMVLPVLLYVITRR